MSTIPLPVSFLECCLLVAAGWCSTTSQASLMKPSVKQAATQLMRRVTFPAFIFQVLAAGGGALVHSAQIAFSTAFAHMLLCLGAGCVMWGVAGAQVAVMVACAAAIIYPMFTFVVGHCASTGVPADLKHADGGVYTGQWSRASKNGLGVYRYKNGAKYEGWWKDNLKHGRGVYIYADAGRFEGEFVNGVRHGTGVRIWPNGTVKAAYFDNSKKVRDVELAAAAHVMQAANEAANAARHVSPTHLSLPKAARQSFLNPLIIACSAFLMAAAVSVPVTEAMETALATVASIHIPLGLVLFGANLPKSTPEKRHVPKVRTVLATRLLSALIVAAGALMCATSSEHAIQTAAVAASLLTPVSSQALVQAREWGLSQALVEGVATTSTLLSALCMGLFSVQAWVKDVVPIFAVMSTGNINTFPLVDHCLVQFGLLSLSAYFAPRIFSRKVLKMTLTSNSFRQRKFCDTEQSQNDLPGSGGMRSGSVSALGIRSPRQSGCRKHMPGTRWRTLEYLRTCTPRHMVPKSGHSRPMFKL